MAAPSEPKLAQDPATLRREAVTDAVLYAKEEESARRRALSAMAEHMLQPATIHSLEIHGARNTRKDFLDPLFRPLVDDARNAGTTLGDVLQELQAAVAKLERFDIFKPDPTVHLSDARQRDPAAAATDVDIALRVAELPRFRLNTGTDLGNAEGSAYGNVLWRNILGGGETLSLSASAGTRTRSAYRAELSAPPVPGDPDLRVALEGLASATHKPWASHDEALQAAALRLAWRSSAGHQHTLAYGAAWRQITGLAAAASPAVRRDAGDSLKSALSHTFVCDRRDNPLLPQRGYLVRTAAELAGWGPLGGDVSFAKAEAEVAGALPVPVPSPLSSSSSASGIALGAGLRAGLLYPLPFGYNPLAGPAVASRVNDRFVLGGPADVRGFVQAGLGPHDGPDAVGGDLFAAGALSLLLPVTRGGPDAPLRLQLFANSGRLVALRPQRKSRSASVSSSAASAAASAAAPSHASVPEAVVAALQDLATGLPSTAVGVGLVYAHPAARFELNFGLPLVMRRGEESRKGLQVGVGINFM